MFIAYYAWLTLSATVVLNDSGLFAELTRIILKPDLRLYVDLWDNKPPGLFFFAAPFVFLFGTTTFAIQLAAICEALLFAATTALLAQIFWTKRLINVLAFIAALFYALVIVVTRSIETTLLMCSLGNLSLYIILRGHKNLFWLCLSGLVFSWAVFSKQPIALQFVALTAAIAYVYRRKRFIPAMFALCVGGAIGIGLFLIWALTASDLTLIWEHLIGGNVQYSVLPDQSDAGPTLDTYYLIRETIPILLPLAIASIVSLWLMLREGQIGRVAILVLCLITAFIGASLGKSLKFTYFLQMMPFVVGLTAFLMHWLYKRSPLHRASVTLLFSLIMIISVQGYYQGTVQFIEMAHDTDSPTLTTSTYIAENSEPDDCIWIWGYANNLSFYSGRRSCTAVPYDGIVMNATAFDTSRYQVNYLNDLFRNPPSFLFNSNTWGYFPMLNQYAERYVRDAIPQTESKLFNIDTSAFQPMQTNFGDYFTLIGTDIVRSEQLCAGDTIAYAPTWRSHQATPIPYQMFLHVRAVNDDRLISQFDGDAATDYPTQDWKTANEVILSPTIEFVLPEDLPAGDYYAVVGFYDLDDLTRIPILANGTSANEEPIDFFHVESC